MSAAPTRPRLRARFERRREEILDEAATLFAARGFGDTSMRDLLEATGFTVGRLYHYIGTKDDLLFGIYARFADPLLEEMRAIVEAERPAAVQLRETIKAWLEHAFRRRDYRTVVIKELPALLRGPHAEEIRARRAAYDRLLEQLVCRLQIEHQLRLGDAALTAAALPGLIESAVRLQARGHTFDVEQVVDRFCDALLAS